MIGYKMASMLLLILTMLGTGLSQQADDTVSSTYLRYAMMMNYDKTMAPSEPLMLRYGISPVKVVDMNIKRGLVTVDLWLKHQWVDERLVWDPSSADVLFFTRQEVYVPESDIYNGVMKSTMVDDPDVVVYPAGQMVFFPAVRAEVYCNLPEPPFQNQICPIIIGPWAHDRRQIQLTTFDPVVDHSFVYNTGLTSIGQSTANITSSEYECCQGLQFDTMTLNLNLSCRVGETTPSRPSSAQALRQVSADVDKTSWSYNSLPVIITPFYVLLIFLLPAKSTGRIFLGMLICGALLLIWTSGAITADQERFLVMSICLTIAATCTSLVSCMVSALNGSTDLGDDYGIKRTVCKARLGRMVDLTMLAVVAVVLGISAAGLYA